MTDGFVCEKNLEVRDNFKVGDILVGKTHMYRTVTYWYKVIKVTKKQLVLKELQVSYPTEYMSNTFGDECMPVLEVGDQHLLICGFPYWTGPRKTETVTASVARHKFDHDKDWTVTAEIRGDRYAPSLTIWDGTPGWVNCD